MPAKDIRKIIQDNPPTQLKLKDFEVKKRAVLPNELIAVRVQRTAGNHQSIANNTTTTVVFNPVTIYFDTHGMFDSSANTRLTCKKAGIYVIIGQTTWASNNTGRRLIRIIHNGTNTISEYHGPANSTNIQSAQSISTIYYLEVNDYLEMEVNQNSGGALDLLAQEHQSPVLCVAKLSEYGYPTREIDTQTFEVL